MILSQSNVFLKSGGNFYRKEAIIFTAQWGPTTPHKNIETNSRFTRKIDISSHMESLKFQSGNDETA